MNGGVSCVQFDCDVDEHLFLNGLHRCHARGEKTWHMVVDLSCFCDVLVVSSCGSETTTFDQKVQWSSFEKRRGDDVMSTSFWFQGVQYVACFVVCPHFVFKFGFACRVAGVWVRHSTATVCAMCVCGVFGAVTRWLLCCRRSPRLFNIVAHCVEGMCSVSVVCSLSNISGSHV